MATLLQQLLRDDAGQDLLEYALLSASVGLAGIATWPALVAAIGTTYGNLDQNTQNLWRVPNPGGGS